MFVTNSCIFGIPRVSKRPLSFPIPQTCKCICGIKEVTFVLTNATPGKWRPLFLHELRTPTPLRGPYPYTHQTWACMWIKLMTDTLLLQYQYISWYHIYILLCVCLFGYPYTKIHNVLYSLLCVIIFDKIMIILSFLYLWYRYTAHITHSVLHNCIYICILDIQRYIYILHRCVNIYYVYYIYHNIMYYNSKRSCSLLLI